MTVLEDWQRARVERVNELLREGPRLPPLWMNDPRNLGRRSEVFKEHVLGPLNRELPKPKPQKAAPRRESSRKFICQFCGKGFINPQNRLMHQGGVRRPDQPAWKPRCA